MVAVGYGDNRKIGKDKSALKIRNPRAQLGGRGIWPASLRLCRGRVRRRLMESVKGGVRAKRPTRLTAVNSSKSSDTPLRRPPRMSEGFFCFQSAIIAKPFQ